MDYNSAMKNAQQTGKGIMQINQAFNDFNSAKTGGQRIASIAKIGAMLLGAGK